jgi:hypothetical protein
MHNVRLFSASYYLSVVLTSDVEYMLLPYDTHRGHPDVEGLAIGLNSISPTIHSMDFFVNLAGFPALSPRL